MNESHHERFSELLRHALGGPVNDTELERDLWPRMLQKLDARPFRPSWFDWALAALLPVWFFWFPNVIPELFYHL